MIASRANVRMPVLIEITKTPAVGLTVRLAILA